MASNSSASVESQKQARFQMSANSRHEILKRLTSEYQASVELNGTHIETLRRPSPIEFLRAVRIGRPVIIKDMCPKDLAMQLRSLHILDVGFRPPALDRWSDEYLVEKMGDKPVSVDVTPNGNADAIVADDDGRRYFVEPHVERVTMRDLIKLLSPERHKCDSRQAEPTEVYYLQSQNGNLYTSQSEDDPSEFDALREDVPKEVSWASEALGGPPDAVNIWIGDGRSVTSVHSDPYENIYTVVRGEKRFTLFPPTEGWCLQERMFPHARYTRANVHSPLALTPSPPSTPSVRWSSVLDPVNPAELPVEAQPLHITLLPGDTLYLPVGWWHYVRQSGMTIALNWWYDMEARGMGWVWLNFLRGECNEVLDGNDDSRKFPNFASHA